MKETEKNYVDLTTLRLDGDTQPRVEIDQDTVDAYAADLKDGAEFPPVIVYYDGKHHWLADGFHRVLAAAQLEMEAFGAEIREGTRRDAVLHSVGANATHGLRRTNADKRAAVEKLLRDEEWVKWADREIARACHVSHKTVSRIRSDLEASGEIPQITKRTYERDGQQITVDTSNIGQNQPARPSDDEVDAEAEREAARQAAMAQDDGQPPERTWPPTWLAAYTLEADRLPPGRSILAVKLGGIVVALRTHAHMLIKALGGEARQYMGELVYRFGENESRKISAVKLSAVDEDKLPGECHVIEMDNAGELKMMADQQLDTLDVTALLVAKAEGDEGKPPAWVDDDEDPRERLNVTYDHGPYRAVALGPLFRYIDGEEHSDYKCVLKHRTDAGGWEIDETVWFEDRGKATAWYEAAKVIAREKTAAAVPTPEGESLPHYAQSGDNGGTVEWWTPKPIIDKVRALLFSIDLDPASCDEANETVGAARIFTKEDDGLEQIWKADTLFLNPPYGDQIGDWIEHLIMEWTEGNVKQAVALVRASTDTAWFRQLANFPKCFIHGRVKFEGPNDSGNSATFPSVLVGLGVNVDRFADVFGELGDIAVPYMQLEAARKAPAPAPVAAPVTDDPAVLVRQLVAAIQKRRDTARDDIEAAVWRYFDETSNRWSLRATHDALTSLTPEHWAELRARIKKVDINDRPAVDREIMQYVVKAA